MVTLSPINFNAMKFLVSLSFAMVITASGLAQDATSANCQLSSVVQIDGQANEWPMEWMVDTEKKFSYNVCSDDNNIYIRMKTKDELIRRKMALFGFTVWMDPNGKKKRKLGLRFPTGIEAQERMVALRQTGDPNTMSAGQRADFQKEINKIFIRDVEVLELIGLADDPLTSTRSGITNGIKVAIAADDEEAYIYEAIIPFKSFRLSKSSIATLGIGFETGKYVMKAPKTPNTGVGTQGPGGNGYSTARNMNRGQSYSNDPMASSTSYWVSVKLK